ASLGKELEALRREQAKAVKRDLIASVKSVGGVNFIAAKVDMDAASIKDVAFQLRAETERLFLVLATAEKGKATLSVALSDDLVKNDGMNAGKIVRELASLIKGGGGGQPFFATAGGKDPSGIAAALAKAEADLSQS
ncbi:MAG: DHHA1 domain-containing protein, partial [Cryomorphaceae bacterium]